MRRAVGVVCCVSSSLVASCAPERAEPRPSAAPLTSSASEPSALADDLEPLRDASTSSSALELARWRGRTLAFLADEDDRRLRLFDLDTRAEIASKKLGQTPAHVTVSPSRIFVALRDTSKVASFRLTVDGELTADETIATPAEPIGLQIAHDTLFITCGWGRAFVAHPLAESGRRFTAPLEREPRGFAIRGDEAIVSHAVGSTISTVSLTDGTVESQRSLRWRDRAIAAFTQNTAGNVPRHAVQGFSVAVVGDRAFLPMVLAYPGDPLTSNGGYGMSEDAVDPFFPHEPVLVTLPLTEGGTTHLRLPEELVSADVDRQSISRRARPLRPPCLLPRSIARYQDRVLVACLGLSEVIDYTTADAELDESERRRVSVPAGPSAIAVDAEQGRAWVWSLFDRKLSSLALEPAITTTIIDVEANAPFAAAAGRRAFHTPIAFDGRSCASCHIDGRDDGLVWNSPAGLLQTPTLAERVKGTDPFGWRGEDKTIQAHVQGTFSRLGAAAPTAGTLDALAAYLTTMPSHHVTAPDSLTEAQERGRELFNAPHVACASCHRTEGVWTDGTRRDVGTGAAFDTPSLRFVADTAPYMHDGRFATLRDVLVSTDGKMGYTRGLDEADISALIAYLETMLRRPGRTHQPHPNPSILTDLAPAIVLFLFHTTRPHIHKHSLSL